MRRTKSVLLGFVAGAVVGAVVTRMIIRREEEWSKKDESDHGGEHSLSAVITSEAASFVKETNRAVHQIAEDIDDLLVEARTRFSSHA